MKATRSKDGRYRATITIPFRIDREALGVAATWLVLDTEPAVETRTALDVTLKKLTRARVLAKLKELISRYGEESYHYRLDEYVRQREELHEEMVHLRDLTYGRAFKLFPELTG